MGFDSQPDAQNPTEPKFRILVIDDEPALVRVLAAAFREFGHTVHTAGSGLQGIGIFEEQPVDVIICDLGMPDMSGCQVASRIGAICRNRLVQRPPLILLTGSEASPDEAREMEESGVDMVVEKPAGVRVLMDAINEVVRRNAPRPMR